MFKFAILSRPRNQTVSNVPGSNPTAEYLTHGSSSVINCTPNRVGEYVHVCSLHTCTVRLAANMSAHLPQNHLNSKLERCSISVPFHLENTNTYITIFNWDMALSLVFPCSPGFPLLLVAWGSWSRTVSHAIWCPSNHISCCILINMHAVGKLSPEVAPTTLAAFYPPVTLDFGLWMTSTFELDLCTVDTFKNIVSGLPAGESFCVWYAAELISVKMNQLAEYLGQRSFSSTSRHMHAHRTNRSTWTSKVVSEVWWLISRAR